eukprot:TRINITY_DN26212_c0_g1_i1.p1 TRINITY_DN26212_c0_g1~~TRINITY_DN26212_c0_g1_i1.p1  ORF type:complete len:152 (-),score=23.56 TRINITY_DN26212_c0_g1_i1:33-488(-)
MEIKTVAVLNNPGKFTDCFEFDINFECKNDLKEDIEWRLVYVGSSASEKDDQILESVLVGPIISGTSQFILKAPPPDPSKIPNEDLIGVTVILLRCLYKNREFLRTGFYVNNEYEGVPEGEAVPEPVDYSKITRTILSSTPMVTPFPIDWD